MKDLKVRVPTYVGGEIGHGKPNVPVYVQDTDSGLNIVLGAHGLGDREYLQKPNLFIERRPGGWAMVLTSRGGDDPAGMLYFLDDGRCVLMKEVNSALEVREASDEPPAELADHSPQHGS